MMIELADDELEALRFAMYEASYKVDPNAPCWVSLSAYGDLSHVAAKALAAKLGVPDRVLNKKEAP